MYNKTSKVILSSFALAIVLFQPIAQAKLIVEDREMLLNSEEVISYYNDVEMPSKELFESDPESYYQDLGILLLSMEWFNGEALLGYENEDGTRSYKPENTLTRAEAAKFFATFREEELNANWTSSESPEDHFTDFTGLSQTTWYVEYAVALKKAGDISGYPDGSFKATNTLNGAEVAKFVNNVYNLRTVDESEGENWYNAYVQAGKDFEVFPENFDPSKEVTRGEMASYILRGAIVEYFGGERAFNHSLLSSFLEEKGHTSITLLNDETRLFYGFNYIHEMSDDVIISEVVNDGSTEYVVLDTLDAETDLSGYTLAFMNGNEDLRFSATSTYYIFPQGSLLMNGEGLKIYNMGGGDYVFENGSGLYGDGIMNDFGGLYTFLLYDAEGFLVDLSIVSEDGRL